MACPLKDVYLIRIWTFDHPLIWRRPCATAHEKDSKTLGCYQILQHVGDLVSRRGGRMFSISWDAFLVKEKC